MNIKRAFRALFLLLLCSDFCRATAAVEQGLTLRLLERDATTTRLSVAEAAVPNVNLEGSFDLENWFVVDSVAPVQGTALFAHTNTEGISTWFFRAVAAPAPIKIDVGAMPDTNQVVIAVITPETGGKLEITDANGVFYQLTIGTNLLDEPMAIAMTVITNFSNIPLTNRFRAAVALSPEGLEFRGAAELKIRFPSQIPTLEMVGYGFAGSGSDFHLRPWDSSSNEVTLAVSHFSGTGVAAEPFQPSGTPGLDYGRGLKYTREGIQDADSWAGNAYRENLRLQDQGLRTREQGEAARRLIRIHRNYLVYGNAIRSLELAARRDCSLAQVLIKRLEQLLAETPLGYGHEFFQTEAARMASSLRCVCARYYLEKCEMDAISGIIAKSELSKVLDFAALHTGLVEQPDCDLGSDFDIDRRMARAKCHKPWEGTVRYSKTFRQEFDMGDFFGVEQLDVAYYGQLTELLEEDGDPDGDWQSWDFKLAGKFTATRYDSDTFISRDPDWTVTDTDVTKGSVQLAAIGRLIIRFDDGVLNDVNGSAGLDGIRYPMPLQRTTARSVECRGQNCPPSIAPETKSDGMENLSFAESAGVNETSTTVESRTNGSLKIISKTVKREELPDLLNGHHITTETLTVQIWKASAP